MTDATKGCRIACKNLEEAVREASQRTPFDFADAAAV